MWVMATSVSVNDVLDGHVALDLECLDRVYLNAYVPNRSRARLSASSSAHLGNPIPSPAIFDKIGSAFRKAVAGFAEREHIPVLRFTKTDRKIEKMRPYIAAQAKTGRCGVAAIGVAQEYANVFTGTQRDAPNGIPWFSFYKADRRVNCYYFYLWDDDFGPAFIKICAYFPYPAKIWINGHEYAKRQAIHAGIGFTELSNGFAATNDPPACKRSATSSGRPPSRRSSNAGSPSCRCHSPSTTRPAAIGGKSPCDRSKCRRPSCSPNPATHEGSSTPWSLTTSISAVPNRSS